MQTKLFLDSGDPKETRTALKLLGFLDGQTTNPSLIAKNPHAVGKKFSQAEIYKFYQGIVTEIASQIPQGSVSIEVYADATTTAEQMLKQAVEFNSWIPNAHIKLPTTAAGLTAAGELVKQGIRINMTLVFSQAQAAAIYAATRGVKPGDVFVSPFVGRLDDRGENGMDLINNILRMYQAGDGHVQVLAASIRTLEHFVKTLEYNCDLITAPLKAFQEWTEAKKNPNFQFPISNLKPIPYEEINLEKDWQEYDIAHELTDKGLAKFVSDWNNLIS